MFKMYRADCVGVKSNCLYPHEVDITDAASLAEAASYDYVCATYKGNYRSNDNFEVSDCLAVECDNDHSDNPKDWIWPKDVAAAFPGVEMAFHYSRHHMKPKNGKSARPRHHCFLRIRPVKSAGEYAAMKQRVYGVLPLFDKKAMDAARFFFGTPSPQVEFFPGDRTLDDFFEEEEEDFDAGMDAIPEGSRNDTMFRWAVRALKRYGNTDETRKRFDDQADKCSPPLDQGELDTIWRSAEKFYKTIASQPGYVKPDEYNGTAPPRWTEPIPFGKYTMAAFPTDALPTEIADYVSAVAESTQTPVDMAGTAALTLLAVCIQGKYRVQGKPDWIEPLNLYANVIAMPSERKSAVLHATANPLDTYELQYNQRNAARVEGSKMQKRILERRQKAVEEQVAKGKAEPGELDRVAQEVADFVEEKPLHLYVDDITTEKLVSVMASNHGRAALVSSEGGIFDTLAGIYTKNVNIDVMLKGYSGDTIRVDRIGRESESIMGPALTILLMTQPKVVSDVLSNATFRGRGLTARFLYCMPDSSVGSRRFQSESVQPAIYQRYEQKIVNLLEDEYPATPETITLSPEASDMLTAFAEEIEPKLTEEYSEMADWVGKLVGNTLRIAGLLCRAGIYRAPEFLNGREKLVVSGETMANAIRLGRYYLNHAQAVYDVMPEDSMYRKAARILQMIEEKKLTEFDRRSAMRNCRTFKTVAEIQPVLDFLDDYGYIARMPEKAYASGRPPLPKYAVNPMALKVFRLIDPGKVTP